MALEPIEKTSDGKRHSFVDFVWERFDPLVAIETLLRPDEAFFAEKHLIFCALSAWMVDPSNDDLRKLAISRQVALQLISLESDRSSGRPPALGNVERHIVQWAEPEIAAFYDEVYFPIGGLKTIISIYPSSNFHDQMAIASGSINTAVRVAAIYHFHAINFADRERFYPSSLSKASELLGQFELKPRRGEGGADKHNVKKQWSRCKKSISLAYAASEMSIRDQRYSDLLDVMQQGRVSWEKHGRFLAKLLERANYVEQQIFSKCYKNEGVPFPFGDLPNISERSFKPREFSEADKLRAFVAFARHPGVKKSP